MVATTDQDKTAIAVLTNVLANNVAVTASMNTTNDESSSKPVRCPSCTALLKRVRAVLARTPDPTARWLSGVVMDLCVRVHLQTEEVVYLRG